MWATMNAKWSRVLCTYKVPVFHSNVFFNRKKIKNPKKNPYHGWSDRKANDFLGELLKIVSGQRKLTRLVAAIRVADFEQYSYMEKCAVAGHIATPAIRKSRDPMPYHLVFRLLLNLAASTSTPDTKLHFMVADQEEYRQRALDSWALTKALGTGGWEHKLESIEFEEPIHQAGLQVADLLGWQLYNSWTRRDAGEAVSRQNISAMNVLNRRIGPVMAFTRTDMEAWINLCITPEDREFLRNLTREDWETHKEVERMWQRRLNKLRRGGTFA
jgi:hypothetical protein